MKFWGIPWWVWVIGGYFVLQSGALQNLTAGKSSPGLVGAPQSLATPVQTG